MEDITKRVYRQHNTKPGYEFFIDTISYRRGQCAERIWINKEKDLSRQCSRKPHFSDLFCKQHSPIEQTKNQNVGV